MTIDEAWGEVIRAIDFARSRIVDDETPRNEREEFDGQQYVIRSLTAVLQSSLATFDPQKPAFMAMLDSVRYLGAAGPDIDYDVAIVEPGIPHRITGTRGAASYVGITVYSHAGSAGAAAIVAFADVDALTRPDGTFVYEFHHLDAARVIIRQYFHDRASQHPGSWSIERLGSTANLHAQSLTPAGLAARLTNAAHSLRWNLQLNQLWSPERRSVPNELVHQLPDEIVAAVPNPDVNYTFGWWSIGPDEMLEISVRPPDTRYWSLQICDRWFQCFPQRRTNLNDRQIVADADGTIRLILADGDPGEPNWLDTGGHRIGVMFFRWLHAHPAALPTCRVVPRRRV